MVNGRAGTAAQGNYWIEKFPIKELKGYFLFFIGKR